MVKGMKVLVIGSGGREDAICQALKGHDVYCSPGNGNTRNINEDPLKFAIENNVDLVVIGPEQPLVDGLSDQFKMHGIPCFGPSQKAAQIEGSKAYCKDFMKKYDIPTAKYEVFSDFDKAKAYIEAIDYDIVIKTSGLAAGKGVLLPESKKEAIENLQEMMVNKRFGDAGSTVVIEQLLQGTEVSVLAFSDGFTTSCLPPTQDHKRAYDGDMGPNTGGMGAFCPSPMVSDSDLQFIHEKIIQKAIDGMRQEKHPFVGILYAGIMLTANGPMNLEFNCRFGDPETQIILPLLKTPLSDLFLACCHGYLDTMTIEYHNKKSLGVVLASKGYPGTYEKNDEISMKPMENVIIYHAGTKKESNKLLTNGGRVFCVVSVSESFDNCRSLIYDQIDNITFNKQYRTDIGKNIGNKQQSMTYASAGVDIDKGNHFIELIKKHVKSTATNGSTCELGGFGGLYDLKAYTDNDLCLVCCTDGVGTKLKLAMETGCYEQVGIDLVAMSVNDLLVQGADPLLFLDYYACGHLELEIAEQVVKGIAKGCKLSECALIGGETAEMPGMYSANDFDLAGFAVGAVYKNNIFPKIDQMDVGNVLIGLKSSGIHSNGYSLVRKLIKTNKIDLSSKLLDSTVKDLLMTPTRLYVQEIKQLKTITGVYGFAHITGGGLNENVIRSLPNHLKVNYEQLELPPLFKWLQQLGNISNDEMWRTFNCGIGMVVIVSKDIAPDIKNKFGGVVVGQLKNKLK